jgi:hypothetical protein
MLDLTPEAVIPLWEKHGLVPVPCQTAPEDLGDGTSGCCGFGILLVEAGVADLPERVATLEAALRTVDGPAHDDAFLGALAPLAHLSVPFAQGLIRGFDSGGSAIRQLPAELPLEDCYLDGFGLGLALHEHFWPSVGWWL